MNGLPYYKAYPADFLEGTIGMGLEVKGAYRILLDLIYQQGGQLQDDPHYIAGNLGCGIRKWKIIREELISRGKISAENGIISNLRACKELEKLSKYQDSQAGIRRGCKKNKGLQKPARVNSDSDSDTVEEERAKALLSKTAEKANGFDPTPFVEIWNSVCGQAGLPRVVALKGPRRAKAILRWHEDFGGVVDRWGAYCRQIAAAPHLTGDNDRGWKASLGWVIEPSNMEKIQEGNYDGGRKRVDPSLGAARILGLTGEPMAGEPVGAGIAPDDRGGGGFSNPQLCFDAGGENEPVVVRPIFPGTRR